ncbi:Acyl carrier protein 2, chloroplastic [Glycine soja]|nr:Acyl carrier protein 2, chloroplastic [Glycine soja]
MFGELKFVNKVQLKRETKTSFALSGGIDTIISCSTAELETLKIVQSTIAKQLFIDEATVTPQTKFSDVEIMMALEEKFEISIGEGGAENISTVQDAADLIEKVTNAST